VRSSHRCAPDALAKLVADARRRRLLDDLLACDRDRDTLPCLHLKRACMWAHVETTGHEAACSRCALHALERPVLNDDPACSRRKKLPRLATAWQLMCNEDWNSRVQHPA
jgi:hypothetical protein